MKAININKMQLNKGLYEYWKEMRISASIMQL